MNQYEAKPIGLIFFLDCEIDVPADHAHCFEIPRGGHPQANDDSRAAFSRLNSVFLDHLHADRPATACAMREAVAVCSPPLRRSSNYLHSIIGGRSDGSLRYLAAHGRLETLGERLVASGCVWAVCLENSGSVMPTFLPAGVEGPRIPLTRAPNFRPAGRAVIVIQLRSARFASESLFEDD